MFSGELEHEAVRIKSITLLPKKIPSRFWRLGIWRLNLAMTYFRMVEPTLSLALSSFTSEFGMGSGGSRSLLSPGNSDGCARTTLAKKSGKSNTYVSTSHSKMLERYMVKPHG